MFKSAMNIVVGMKVTSGKVWYTLLFMSLCEKCDYTHTGNLCSHFFCVGN